MSRRPTPSRDLDALTRPERAVEVRDARKVLKIVQQHQCFCCLRRDRDTEGWGKAACGLPRPALFNGPGCQFDPDWDRIYAKENVE